MSKYILKAVEIIKSNVALILILIFPLLIQISGIKYYPAMLIGQLLSLILIPAIYGRLTQIITGEQHLSYIKTFKMHWFNFYSVGLILLLPLIPFWILSNRNIGPAQLPFLFGIIAIFILIALRVFAIYIMPMVFLKRVNTVAIIAGIKCLINNFRYSLPLIFLSLLIFIVRFSLKYLTARLIVNYFFIGAAIILIQGFIVLFINFIIFITASLVLTKGKKVPS